ncbi:VanZ family protein [Clostridium sp. WB02_MRS01]|uniref:VanZ family protein n=1 Tax=Clostridium sp. WB02_MRS01 TaxID=2605777 RepID=UPI0012B43931|nr:VanZ family protein [Clostridium sp. WB02_MRS01]MSS10113.1 VanZ family protein [Clostridium sp. WB02_MRS01]
MAKKIIYNIITQDIIEPLSYLPKGLICGAILITVLIIINVLWYQFRRCLFISPIKIIYLGLFVAYIYTLLQQTYFSRPPGSRNTVSLILGETWQGSVQSRAYVIENILMMIPFGVLLPNVLKPAENIFCCISLGFFFSVNLEYAQFLSQRGHMQVDDVIMNVIGTVIGYLFFVSLKLLCKLSKNFKE